MGKGVGSGVHLGVRTVHAFMDNGSLVGVKARGVFEKVVDECWGAQRGTLKREKSKTRTGTKAKGLFTAKAQRTLR
jgi:hypothetical protein